MPENSSPQLLRYSWEAFEQDIVKVDRWLSTIEYDLLVGIAAGGLIPLVKLKNLQDRDYSIIQCRSYKERKQGDLVIQGLPTVDVNKKKVMLIDDISDHGTTLAVVRQQLLEVGAKEVLTCTIFYKPHSIIKPDFYTQEVPNGTWVLFPWEKQLY